MNAIKFSLFVHPYCLCDMFKGSGTRPLLVGVEVNITWSSLCTRPKCLHGVVLTSKFRGKFILLNLYPAVCWRRHCTYGYLFLLLYCPNFMNINWKSYLQVRLKLWETSINSGCLNRGCWGGCLDRRRTKWQKAGCRSVFLAIVACRPVKKYSFWNDFTVFISSVSPRCKRRTTTFRNLGSCFAVDKPGLS